LAALVEAHPEHELVVAGDFFDLAFDPPSKDPCASIGEILGRHRALVHALGARLKRGVPVTLLAGNHDAAIGSPDAREHLLRALGLPEDVPLTTFPWFIRRAGVHIEHGHFYDPDNAPNHPLSQWDHRTEPLGVALTRRFIAPNGAMMFAGDYQVTPMAGFMQVLSEYRLRAPLVIANYFAAAGGLCVRAHTERRNMAEESERGTRALHEHSEQLGVTLGVLERLLGGGARPTHQGFRDTFMRLYFDRIFASFGTAAGLILGALGSPQGWLLAGAGASYLAFSVTRQGSRYLNLPGERLREAAERVLSASDATTVIFGHSHVEDQAAGYCNLGSFSFSSDAARPYAEIDAAGHVTRRRFRGVEAD
jgi:hypothetical protein